MILGCMLTPPVNNSYTGTIVVSSISVPPTPVLTGIRIKTAHRISTARAAALCLDVVLRNGVRHHTDLLSMPKEAAFSL